MSKKQKPRKPADGYKRGYANGVQAAVDALLEDLAAAGKLDAEEYDEDGLARRCKGCMVAASGFEQLAQRWQFTLGIKC